MLFTTVDTLIRFHDFSFAETLRDALLSLAGQERVDVRPLILTQSFDSKQLAELESQLQDYRHLFSRGVVVKNVMAKGGDGRSQLLNAGIASSEAEFISILDCDDVLYPDALSTLTAAAKDSNSAIAFGAIVWARTEIVNRQAFIRHKDFSRLGGSQFDLFVDNFCPIHSFVVNRGLIANDDLRFDESMSALEDYEFLLRIVSKYKSDFSATDRFVGEYRRRDSDTIRTLEGRSSVELSPLDYSRERILSLKKTLAISVDLASFSRLARSWGRTVPKAVAAEETAVGELLLVRQAMISSQEALSAMFSCSRHWPFHPRGVLDQLVISTTAGAPCTNVGGWVLESDGSPFVGEVFALTGDGRIAQLRLNVDREDLAALGMPLRCGFSEVVRNCIGDVVVLLASLDGQITRLKPIEC